VVVLASFFSRFGRHRGATENAEERRRVPSIASHTSTRVLPTCQFRFPAPFPWHRDPPGGVKDSSVKLEMSARHDRESRGPLFLRGTIWPRERIGAIKIREKEPVPSDAEIARSKNGHLLVFLECFRPEKERERERESHIALRNLHLRPCSSAVGKTTRGGRNS